MKLMTGALIPKIDDYAHSVLNISKKSLVLKSAEAVFSAVSEALSPESLAVILAGKGNNGADGYALSTLFVGVCRVKVVDVFGMGQRSEEGKYYLGRAKELGVDIIPLDDSAYEEIERADILIEAIVGTGVTGSLGEPLLGIAAAIEKSRAKLKVAIDLPIGVNPDTGAAVSCAPHFDKTVALSFVKPGVLSYPGREYAGEIVYSDLALPKEKILSVFETKYTYTDEEFATEALPKRGKNTNKGSYGRLAILSGSEKYGGAPRLTLEAALRGGVGYVEFVGEEGQNKEMLRSFPEAIYKVRPAFDKLSKTDIEEIIAATEACGAIVIGPGCGMSEGLVNLLGGFLAIEGATLVIDADGINALSELIERRNFSLGAAKRRIILTPHPGEFSRLTGAPVSEIQGNRLELSVRFAKENSVVLLLKGAGSIITDGDAVYINGTGSAALAKAGSGDALAGLVGAFVALGSFEDDAVATALAAYIHGAAGDTLEEELSSYGVTPSDLPKEMARQIRRIERIQ